MARTTGVCPARTMIPSLARVRSLCIGKSECSSPPLDPATTATARPLRVLHWHLQAWSQESGCSLPWRNPTPKDGLAHYHRAAESAKHLPQTLSHPDPEDGSLATTRARAD